MGKRNKKKPNPLNQKEFQEGDIVGAKVKGHPLWPGYVEKVKLVNNKRTYQVRFFGTQDSGQKFETIIPFSDLKDKDKLCKKRGFDDALKICQEKFNRYGSNMPIEGSESPDESPSQTPVSVDAPNSPVTKSPMSKSPIRTIPDDDKNATTTATPKSLDQPKNISEQKNLESNNGDQECTSMDETVKNTTINKLKQKLSNKMAEKYALKQKYMASKLNKKVSTKLEIFNRKLLKFSTALKKISEVKSPSTVNINEWKDAVRKFFVPVLPVLNKCIESSRSNKFEVYNLEECRKCHETLKAIWMSLRSCKNNSQMPQEIRLEVLDCISKIKAHGMLRKLVTNNFENLKNELIERKENNAQQEADS